MVATVAGKLPLCQQHCCYAIEFFKLTHSLYASVVNLEAFSSVHKVILFFFESEQMGIKIITMSD